MALFDSIMYCAGGLPRRAAESPRGARPDALALEKLVAQVTSLHNTVLGMAGAVHNGMPAAAQESSVAGWGPPRSPGGMIARNSKAVE